MIKIGKHKSLVVVFDFEKCFHSIKKLAFFFKYDGTMYMLAFDNLKWLKSQ